MASSAAPAASPSGGHSSPDASAWLPLRNAFFRMLWLASFVSNVGTWMQNVGAVSLMTRLTPSPVLVALLQTAAALPVFLLSLPAGALADLLDRRRLLLWTQAWMGTVALVLAALALMGQLNPWLLLALTFLLGLGAALNNPVWAAIMPELVPADQLPAAIALNGVSFNLARAIGPALGGLVLAYLSVGYAFLLNGLSFLATIYMVYAWQRPPQPSKGLAGERLLAAMRGGFRYARFAPPLQVILLRGAVFLFGASALFALLPAVVTHRLHAPDALYSGLLSCMGAGAVAGAFLLPRVSQHLSLDRRVGLATLVFAGLSLALAYVSSWVVLGGLFVLAGAAWLLVLSSFGVAVQQAVPRWVLARSISLYLLVTQGATALGSYLWGALAARSGLPIALGAAAAVLALSLLLARRYSLRHGEHLDFSPAQYWTEPNVVTPVAATSGPFVVIITYRVPEADQPTFAALLQQRGRLRQREGALSMTLYTDLADPERLSEHYVFESWEEHQTERDRGMGAEETALYRQARALHQGPEPPQVSYLLANQF